MLGNVPSRDQMVILQDLARILQKMVILQDLAKRMVILQDSCKTNGYLVSFLQNERLSCKILAKRMAILQDSGKTIGYLARFLQKMVILQDVARFWQKFLQDDVSSCKILPDSGRILQDNHSDPTWGAFAHNVKTPLF